MTTFYKRSELAFRIGVFLSLGPGLSGAFGGLLAAGLLKHDYAGLVSWQRIFVLEVSSGRLSLASALRFALVLAGDPDLDAPHREFSPLPSASSLSSRFRRDRARRAG